MIITVEEIRKYREIALNTQRGRVEIFIRETEQLDIVPVLGALEYERLADPPRSVISFTLGEARLGVDTLGEKGETVLTPEERMLLDGGIWTDECGCLRRFAGLKAAVAYLTFARFVRTHPVQVTPYGVVVKEGDDSSPANAQTIASVSRDSEKIGQQYLKDAIAYWRAVEASRCRDRCLRPNLAARPRFKAIGL